MATAVAGSVYTYKHSPYSSHAKLVGSLPPEGRGKRVLDVGCAAGYLSEILARRGYRVVGVERPGGWGSRFPESVELVEADLDREFPSLRGKFDYVVCGDILEHLRDPGRVLDELAGVLEPGGELIASLPNSGHLYFRLNVLFGRFPQHEKGLFDGTHVRFYMWAGWRELFEKSGFRIVERKVTGVPVGMAFPKWEATALVRALEWLSYSLARVQPMLFAYQFVVTARKGY
jgi:SAM-dependent methyltransferase